MWTPPLARVDGHALCTAAEALLKGFLETDLDVHAVFVVRGSAFGGLLGIMERAEDRAVLARNGVEIIEVLHASRGVELAAQEGSRGRRAAVMISNDELDGVVLALAALARTPLTEGGAICLVLEDNPYAVPTTCPRRVARRTGLRVLEPCDLSGLRDGCDGAMRLSSASGRPAAIICHVSLLRSGATLPVAPNRQVAMTDHAAWLRRRRVPKGAEATDPLQIVRRLEVNRLEHLPNPGEREQYGFLAIGAAAIAVRHMLDELGLSGRVPLLRLVALDPLDEAVVGRLLARCHHVIVVEPRPGSVAPRIVAVAQAMREPDVPPARVWWDALPEAAGDVEPIGINDGMRTSLLTRRVVRLLHEVRPGLKVEERLARIPAAIEGLDIPRRSHGLGVSAAEEAIRTAIAQAAATVEASQVPGAPTRGLVGDRGAPPACDILCTVEVWDRSRFQRESMALLDQVARETRPRVVVMADLGAEGAIDCERLGRAEAGSGVEQRLAFVTVDLNDQKTLHDALVAAASASLLTIIIARDGPPARFDLSKLNRTAEQIDRDGFLRHQRFILPADNACELRDPGLATQVARGLLRGADPLRAEPRVERIRIPGGRGVALKVDLLYEQVEIVRSRPPAALDALRDPIPIAPPQPLHGSSGLWRAHLAGIRGEVPGAAGQLLAEAGRAMGFRVEWTHLGVPIGPGRRAWSQVMFTRIEGPVDPSAAPGSAAEFPSVTVQIPYGEADLVLGVDAVETIRAIATDPQLRVASPSVTAIVANSGPLEDQIDPLTHAAAAQLPEAVEVTTLADRRVVADLASEVRSRFLTDRPMDLVLVGIAFQRGYIPVSIEALEAGARRLESYGYARSFEAVQFGRMLGARSDVGDAAGATAGARTDPAADAARLARRMSADRQLGGRRDRKRGQRLRGAIASTLVRLGPLGESRDGRVAMRDFATAMRRCEMWGGFEYAMRYGELIGALIGSGDDPRGLELARLAILPAAEAFLIRDVWYVGALTTSLDQNHRIRATLGVRLARGDEIHRRYLHRLDIRLASKRWVVEFRSSDWPDRILRATLPFIPAGLRGSPAQRSLRETMASVLGRAAHDSGAREAWMEVARKLHSLASDGTLRTLDGDAVEHIAAEVGPPPVARKGAHAQAPQGTTADRS